MMKLENMFVSLESHLHCFNRWNNVLLVLLAYLTSIVQF